MVLADTYTTVRRSIVAFVPRQFQGVPVAETNVTFPPIVGTGFVVASNGLIVTNDHVAQAIMKLPRSPGARPGELPFNILYLCRKAQGMVVMYFEPLHVARISSVEDPGGTYVGPKPDIAVVQASVVGLPAMDIDSGPPPREGDEVATAGFPMGTTALAAPGYLHQLCPTLQKGIVSAISPFWCETPFSMMLNIMIQGGASGSPVFHPDSGNVVGVLYGSLLDPQVIQVGKPGTDHHRTGVHAFPTNISFAVPAHYLHRSLEQLPPFKLPEDLPSLSDIESALDSGALVVPKSQVVAVDHDGNIQAKPMA